MIQLASIVFTQELYPCYVISTITQYFLVIDDQMLYSKQYFFVTDHKILHSGVKQKKSELRIYCDLLMQQVFAMKEAGTADPIDTAVCYTHSICVF